MAFASYLGDFDVDAETNRLLDVGLEMTPAALGLGDDFASSPDKSSNLSRLASAIPIAYAKAHWRNYAGRCTESEPGKLGRTSSRQYQRRSSISDQAETP
jgi:hypothetical protein